MDEHIKERSKFLAGGMMIEGFLPKREHGISIGETEFHSSEVQEMYTSFGYDADAANRQHIMLEDGQSEDWPSSKNETNSFYSFNYEIKKTKCLECGKILSGTRGANIKRHYKICHNKDIKVGRELKGSDDEQADKFIINYETKKTKCVECGKILSGVRKSNILRHYRLCHKKDINIGHEQRSSDEESADPSSMNDTQKDIIKVENEVVGKIQRKERNTIFYKFLRDINKYECLECGKKISGVRKLCIERHYKLVHKKIIDNGRDQSSSSEAEVKDGDPLLIRPRAKRRNTLNIIIDESKFLKCCIGLLATKNLPLDILDDREFFKTLISPYEEKFGINLNSRNVIPLLEVTANNIRNRIRRRIKKQIISLKIDIATSRGNVLVGLNIQYFKDFKVWYSTLGVLQLNDDIFKCLNEYEIDKSQIYSLTIDSYVDGKQDKKNPRQCDLDSEEDCNGLEDCMALKASILTLANEVPAHSYIIRFVQMAAFDVINLLQTKLTNCRKLVKKIQKLEKVDKKLQFPVLDNDLSWHSTYKMLKLLQENKEYLISVNITTHWNFVKQFLMAFKPLSECLHQLQQEQYIVGDFYRDWCSCELELEDLFSLTPYAKPLHEAMYNKKQILFENVAFTAALYVDPRFNYLNSSMLTNEQKLSAVDHLVKTFEEIQNLENLQTPETMPLAGNTSEEIPISIDTVFNKPSTSKSRYGKLAKHIASQTSITPKNTELQCSLREKLTLLSNCKMIPIHTDILQYYKFTMLDPDISKIVNVVLGLPVNLSSIEAINECMDVVMPHSTIYKSLSKSSLHDLLMIKLNKRELHSKNVRLEYTETD